MAFHHRGFRMIASTDMLRHYAYETYDDTLVNVQADGYFNRLPGVRTNDLISIEAADGACQLRLVTDVVGNVTSLLINAVGAGLVGITPIRKVVGLGNSLIYQNGVASSSQNLTQARGEIAELQSYLHGRFQFDGTLNLGVSGETSAQIAARLPSALATDADTLYTEGGTNDTEVVSEAELWDNLLNKTYLPWLAQKPNLIIRTITQRTQAAWGTETAATTFRKQRSEAIRLRQLAYGAANPGRVIVIDPVAAMNDPGGVYVPRADLFLDGLHYNVKGADLIASVGAPLLASRVPNADYNLNTDPGTLLTNAAMTGNGGTVTAGTGMSGVAPNSWTAVRIRGSSPDSGSIVWSKEARADGVVGEWTVATANAMLRAASDGNERYGLLQTLDVSAGKYAAGDKIEMFAEMQIVSTDGTTLLQASPEMVEQDGTSAFVVLPMAAVAGCPLVPWVAPRVIRTPPITVRSPRSSGTRNILFRINICFDPRTASSWQVRIGRLLARKIT